MNKTQIKEDKKDQRTSPSKSIRKLHRVNTKFITKFLFVYIERIMVSQIKRTTLLYFMVIILRRLRVQ